MLIKRYGFESFFVEIFFLSLSTVFYCHVRPPDIFIHNIVRVYLKVTVPDSKCCLWCLPHQGIGLSRKKDQEITEPSGFFLNHKTVIALVSKKVVLLRSFPSIGLNTVLFVEQQYC